MGRALSEAQSWLMRWEICRRVTNSSSIPPAVFFGVNVYRRFNALLFLQFCDCSKPPRHSNMRDSHPRCWCMRVSFGKSRDYIASEYWPIFGYWSREHRLLTHRRPIPLGGRPGAQRVRNTFRAALSLLRRVRFAFIHPHFGNLFKTQTSWVLYDRRITRECRICRRRR